MAHEADKTQWRLLRYARFIRSNETAQPSETDRQSSSSQPGTWKHFSWSDGEPLMLTIEASSYLLITKGKLILENHWLFDAERVVKGICKGDCILFLQRLKNECRKFRVKLMQGSFSSTVAACLDCVVSLRTFFPVRLDEADNALQTTPASDSISTLQGEASLGSVAKTLLGNKGSDLPLAYRHGNSSLSSSQLAEAVVLCLSDPDFPAFVRSVEDELKTLTERDLEAPRENPLQPASIS